MSRVEYCTPCQGNGTVRETTVEMVPGSHPRLVEVSYTCPTCGGSGRVGAAH
ncbi:hypothetical protein [Spongiactinospora sp. TRM90649]|uniref:hypothetical protein n=1 Tax=Spongiactinospora sp. TRM90649 TaxID=3031114 RepID=UPI0023F818F9|nr:hypothetical protein [Spongiactinospora sp. TRM90649]MDF5758645.1 hypothetical protein [Spongiactinospora sp. TRM90649]